MGWSTLKNYIVLFTIFFIILGSIIPLAQQTLTFTGHDDADDITIVSIGNFNISTKFFDLSNFTLSIDRDSGIVNLTIETYGNLESLNVSVWYQIQSRLIITSGSSSWMYLITALVNLTENHNLTYTAYLNAFTPNDRDTFSVMDAKIQNNKIIILFNISKNMLEFSGDTNWNLHVQLIGHTMDTGLNSNTFYIMDDGSASGIKNSIPSLELNDEKHGNKDIISTAILISAIILIIIMFGYLAMNYR